VHSESMKEFLLPYLKLRWLAVYAYIVILLIVTPYLPLLIDLASSKWQRGSVSGFVLRVEIAIGVVLLLLTCYIFFFNRPKFRPFILITIILITICSLFYLLKPNPFELTHLPEYAILSVLLSFAMRGGEEKKSDSEDKRFYYIRPAAITVLCGTADELYQGLLPLRYFTCYDIFLNGLGGILGLTIFWGIIRK
jgi:hypothetical protein